MKGQTLIEILVALTLVSVVISAVTVILTTALNNAQFSKNQNLSTNYAQEGVETVRSFRDNNYAAFASASGLYCLAKGDTTLGSAQSISSCPLPPNIDNTFIRSVQITPAGCAANVSRVIVTVAWTDGKCQGNYCHSSRQDFCLSTVNPVQGP